MKRLSAILLAAAVLVAASPSRAQQSPSYPVGGFASQRAPGVLALCLNSAGQAVPAAMCDQAAGISKPYSPASPEHRALVVTLSPNSGSTNGFPSNATPTTAVATGTTGAVTATMAATVGKTNYVCSVQVSAIGGTATIGPVTITGLKGGNTLTYQLASTAAGNYLPISFTPCFPASAVNTAIAAATTADGTASAVDVNILGYVQ